MKPFTSSVERLESRIAPAFVAVLDGLNATFTGDATAETLTIVANGTVLAHNRFTAGDPGFVSDLDFDSSMPGEQTLAVGDASTVTARLGGGDDVFTAGNGTARMIVFGGAGDDTILGGNLVDSFSGGLGNDFLDGNQGADTLIGGDGSDRFQWDPGDGSDKIDGNSGADTLIFNGANIAEIFDFSAVNGRLLLTRNIGNITMDVGSVETVDLNLLGGADSVTINDLSSTDVRNVRLHLAAIGGVGDGVVDTLNVIGSRLDDDIRVRSAGSLVEVAGLAALVQLDGFETTDALNVSGGLGLDNVFATSGARAKLVVSTEGEFEDPTLPKLELSTPAGYDAGQSPGAIASGNLFGTGNDLVIANTKSNTLSVLFNAGDGTFGTSLDLETGGTAPKSVVLEDFNGDGHLDIAATNSGSGTVAVLINNNDGTFAAPTLFATGKKPGTLHAADINGDEFADLLVLTSGNKLSVLQGNGAGSFATGTSLDTGGSKPVDFVVGDFSGDGLRDVAIAHAGSNNVTVLTANPDFTFGSPIALRVGIEPVALASGDLDGDGKLDLAVIHAQSRFVSVLLNRSTGGTTNFSPQLKVVHSASAAPTAIAIGDLDNDGRNDLAIANSATGTVSAFLNAGAATFHSPLKFELDNTPARKTAALVVVDLNGDGRLDVATANSATDDVSLLFSLPG